MITFLQLGDNKMGRLGNQLHQIGATISHAKKMGAKAKFPHWNYNKYMLNPIDDSLPDNCDEILEGTWHDTYFAHRFEYIPIPKEKNLVLFGFFQSEKYFDKELVLNTYKPKPEFLQVVKDAGKDFINLTGTVAVHVRHGDYIDRQDCHPVLPISYYENAMVHLYNEVGPNLNFIFFSDDMPWCKQHFRGENIYYAEGNSNIVDMYLMAHCHHHIIANSSFSWWGAWLKKLFTDNAGITIAPQTWFGEKLAHYDTRDLYCEGWKIILVSHIKEAEKLAKEYVDNKLNNVARNNPNWDERLAKLGFK